MPASEARIQANRENSRRSTGPRTAEGKARSRLNAVKHGCAGEGVALGPEELAEAEALAGELEAEMRPSGRLGRILVRRVAVLSTRLDRCVRHEAAAVADHVRLAGERFDRAREDEVESLLAGLAASPAENVRALRRTHLGVDRMVAALDGLRALLLGPDAADWKGPEGERLIALLGFAADEPRAGRVRAVSRATWGVFDNLKGAEPAGLDDPARRRWARSRLVEIIDAAKVDLLAHREALGPDRSEECRAEAADLALFDPSQQATLARRYEAAAERGLYRALKEFRQAEDQAVQAATTDQEATSAPLASFGSGDEPAPPTPREPRPEAPMAWFPASEGRPGAAPMPAEAIEAVGAGPGRADRRPG